MRVKFLLCGLCVAEIHWTTNLIYWTTDVVNIYIMKNTVIILWLTHIYWNIEHYLSVILESLLFVKDYV